MMFDKIKGAVSGQGGGSAGGAGNLQQYVQGIDFPASKDQVISQLQENGAQEDLIAKVKETGKEQFQSQDDLLSNLTG